MAGNQPSIYFIDFWNPYLKELSEVLLEELSNQIKLIRELREDCPADPTEYRNSQLVLNLRKGCLEYHRVTFLGLIEYIYDLSRIYTLTVEWFLVGKIIHVP